MGKIRERNEYCHKKKTNVLIPPIAFMVVCLTCFAPWAVGQTPENATQKTIGSDSVTVSARDLANQVNNPAAPLTLIQFRNILLPNVAGTDGPTNAFGIQPVLPIGPFPSFRFVQLVKVTVSYTSLPSPVGQTGVSNLQIFDLITIKEKWGR